MQKKTAPRKRKKTAAVSPKWDLRLYVAGESQKSAKTFYNLKQLCEEHLAGRYHIRVIDLMKTPQLAQGHQILALPALVRRLPAPLRKVVGNLSDTARVLVGLDLRPYDGNPVVTPETRAHV